MLLLTPLLRNTLNIFKVIRTIITTMLITRVPESRVQIILMILNRLTTRIRHMIGRSQTNNTPILTNAKLTSITTMINPRSLQINLNRPRQQKYNTKNRVSNSTNLTRLISSTIRPVRIMRTFFKLGLNPKRSNCKSRISTNLLRRNCVFIPRFLEPLIKIMVTTMPSTKLITHG